MSRRRRRSRLVLGVCVIVAALLLAGAAAEDTLEFSSTPGEVARRPVLWPERVRVSGTVAPGSVVQEGDLTLFDLDGDGGRLRVLARQALPGAFREGQSAVVEGSVDADLVLHADRVVAQHSNVYEAPPP